MMIDPVPFRSSESPSARLPDPSASLLPVAYAGIGSRAAPPSALEIITRLGAVLARCGLILRSGGAPGADLAFERGCDLVNGKKQIFLPWRGFNRSASPHYRPPPEAYQVAESVHPRWDCCQPASRRLHARNCQQVLGENLDRPVKFVLCWAPEEGGFVTGGTATAIRLAQRRGILTFNLWLPEVRSHWAGLIRAWETSGVDIHGDASLRMGP